MSQLIKFIFGSICMAFCSDSLHSDQQVPSFQFDSLDGKQPIRLSDYRGQVILIVNTASKCGFTPQYKGLENLYRTYKEKKFIVIGVPCNDFGRQEPKGAKEIKQFCQKNYDISFPMTAKYSVIGANAHPFFKWIRQTMGKLPSPKWNFHKYLINREGRVVHCFSSMTKPSSPKLIKAIEQQLMK